MKTKVIWNFLLTAALMLLFAGGSVIAQDKAPNTAPVSAPNQGASLVVNGKRLLTFYSSLDGLSPEERVERAAAALRELAGQQSFSIDSIHATDGAFGTDVVAGNVRIATITDEDAKFLQSNSKILANDFILKAKYALIKRVEQTSASTMAMGVGFCLVGFLALVFVIALICKLAISLCELLDRVIRKRDSGIKIQDAELLSARALLDMTTAVIKLLQMCLICILFCIYAVLALRFFPGTRPLADALIENAKIPMITLSDAILVYLPNLFTLFVIGLITYGAIFVCKFFFNAVHDRLIRIVDFDPDWAEPSYKLARFTVLFFALVCALPYLPGWDTPAFKQLGLVVGVLISFGSSSAVGNMMAGVVLTYTNAFRMGDRIKVAEQVGDVIEKTLFVTKMRTPKGEIVSIPNAQILSGTITNYSAEAKHGGLILHTTVTIGYDVPWRKVHELLISAAKKTEFVLAHPEPFVLQNSLDDFFVTYELNVYTDQAQDILDINSMLHENIQDAFFESGTEIMSPHYTGLRDGHKPAIPAEHLPPGFEPSHFRVEHLTQS